MLALALAQINPTVGDIAGNLALIRKARAEAATQKADLVVLPELCLSGYPPEDLVLKPAFLAACRKAIEDLAQDTLDGGPALLVGTPMEVDGARRNVVVLLDAGEIQAVRLKHDLPNYGVFDEKRVFSPGPLPGPISFRGYRLGVLICEDLWKPDVAEALAETGAEILIVPNGSPFEDDKGDERLSIAVSRIFETGLPLVYVNQLGGQDELVFDGASFALDNNRKLVCRLPSWAPAVATISFERSSEDKLVCTTPGPIAPEQSDDEQLYQAMVFGLGDYVRKNRFPGVILGLSGGIDSAIAAAIAVDALGADMVRAVMMPSPYTSQESLEDAAACAKFLGIRLDEISIEPAMAAFDGMLAPLFEGRAADITEENIQSRARGLTLMALSNKLGHMVLSTGNKSEMSCGYATLYGDMCGGYAVLKDLYKTKVFDLSRWRNENRAEGFKGPKGPVMPERVITKPPSAELRPDQKDEDSLPPYDRLDAILKGLVEREKSVAELVAAGEDEATVRRVRQMLDRAEYKRRQAPPGVKLTRRAFGKERRYPITNGYPG
ncbi:NAD+ synthase [Lacibacterium aquatile]|uniref:Glutamine-dependent NAD(+) synthetase n=1 Tax=Lacibacterium aquatile TaxID=1168082 RepID=A0ABW5DUQ3_9PROT